MKLAVWKYFSVIMTLLLALGAGMTAFNPAPAVAAAPPDPVWWARYGTSFNHWPQAVVADSSGNVYVTGYSYTNEPWDGGHRVYATVKYGSGYVTGQAPAWAKTWKLDGVEQDFAAYAIAVDSTGVYVTGCGFTGAQNNYYTLKYDLVTGAELWASPAICPGEEADDTPRIAVDSTGVYISGSTWRGSSEDYVTIKYNKGTGAVLWGPVYYDGVVANDNDYARGIAVYSGGVYVTGYSEKHYASPHGDYFDVATVKYDSTSGAESWTQRMWTYDSDAQDEAYIAADSSGVYVSAASYLDDNRDTMTVKYPLNDNTTTLWGPKYYGGIEDDDVPSGIAVDASGVYVTGNVEDAAGDDHYYTRKYASANGAMVWEKTYTGHPGDVRGIAVDSTSVYVSGYIRATEIPEYYKYATIKYGLADGAEAWSAPALFSGDSLGLGSYAFAMAADGSGGIYVTGYGYYDASDHYNYLTVKYGASTPPAPTTPTVTAVTPASGNQGQCPMTVTITGTNLTGATSVSFGAGITVSGITVNSATQITATICIDANATPGATSVSVTTPGGTGTKTSAFTVVQQNQSIGTGAPTSHGSSVSGPTTTTQPMSLPNIQPQSASLSATTVTPGTPVTVTANIINKSAVNGNKKVTLYVNGQVETTQGITVNSGGSTQLTFTVSRSEPGNYTVYVDGVPAGSFKVELFRESDGILIFSASLVGLAFILGIVMLWRRQRAV